jgi:hypothetical protein
MALGSTQPLTEETPSYYFNAYTNLHETWQVGHLNGVHYKLLEKGETIPVTAREGP